MYVHAYKYTCKFSLRKGRKPHKFSTRELAKYLFRIIHLIFNVAISDSEGGCWGLVICVGFHNGNTYRSTKA